jgi:hypothetical protein
MVSFAKGYITRHGNTLQAKMESHVNPNSLLNPPCTLLAEIRSGHPEMEAHIKT